MARQLPCYDEQASGWIDDGSAEGLISVKNQISGLVRMPFRQSQFVTDRGNLTPTFFASGYRFNSDGSGSGIAVVTNQGTDAANNNYVSVRFIFWGRVLGLRYLRGIASPGTGAPRDFTCYIDGFAYRVNNQLYEYYDGSLLHTNINGEHCEIIDDNLPDGVHECELIFQGSTDQQDVWTLLGYAVESRVGYVAPPRMLAFCTPQTLSTSYQVPNMANPAASSTIHYINGIRSITYYNVSGSAVTVTMETIYNAATETIIDTFSVPAGGSYVKDFGALIAVDTSSASRSLTIRHKASASASVNSVVLGGC